MKAHLLPVFSFEDEAGWLLLKTGRDMEKPMRPLVREHDDIVYEPKLKAWWVSHGLEQHVVAAFPELCPQCASGVACSAWDEDLLALHEFDARAPSITVREEWAKATKQVLEGLHAHGVDYLRVFVREHGPAAVGKEETEVLSGLLGSVFAGARAAVAGTIFAQHQAYVPVEGMPRPPPPQQGMSADEARAVLRVNADATAEQIKKAFRMRAMETHPDRPGGSAESFKKTAEAYKVLGGR